MLDRIVFDGVGRGLAPAVLMRLEMAPLQRIVGDTGLYNIKCNLIKVHSFLNPPSHPIRVTAFDPGRKYNLLLALAKNMPPAYFFHASRPLTRGPFVLSAFTTQRLLKKLLQYDIIVLKGVVQ